jgi:hypothetical protein
MLSTLAARKGPALWTGITTLTRGPVPDRPPVIGEAAVEVPARDPVVSADTRP